MSADAAPVRPSSAPVCVYNSPSASKLVGILGIAILIMSVLNKSLSAISACSAGKFLEAEDVALAIVVPAGIVSVLVTAVKLINWDVLPAVVPGGFTLVIVLMPNAGKAGKYRMSPTDHKSVVVVVASIVIPLLLLPASKGLRGSQVAVVVSPSPTILLSKGRSKSIHPLELSKLV